ncbi:hypothetical protein [Rhizobium sp. Rhizsp82]|uniref:hypothetical protein n=1 Tax=Rhizobium sp. Rhizsp82 TaxID=3243057 RepID=UPI0039B405AA
MSTYTVTSLDGTLRSSAVHVEDAVNEFAMTHLAAKDVVVWTTTSKAREPSDYPGSSEVLLYEANGDVDPYHLDAPRLIRLFDPKRRYEKILTSVKQDQLSERGLNEALLEIAVLVPVIKHLSFAAAVAQINDVLPAYLRCHVSM